MSKTKSIAAAGGRHVKQISQLEHVKLKTMMSGSKKKQDVSMYLYDEIDNIMGYEKISMTPALNKIIDEIAVNMIDHWTNYPTRVTEMKISFDKKSGELTYRNNGPGILIENVKTIHGKEMYSPQMIASEFLSGDNLDDNSDRKTGGTNGAGLKLTNAFSEYLRLTTNDKVNGILYTQTFRNQLLEIDPPVLNKLLSKESDGFTEIKFKPSYCALGYTGGYNEIRDAATIYKLIQTRAYQISAFTQCDVFFNNTLVIFDKENEIDGGRDDMGGKNNVAKKSRSPIKKGATVAATPVDPVRKSPSIRKIISRQKQEFSDFVRLFNLPNVYHTVMRSNKKKYSDCSWDVSVGVSNGKFQHFSLLNGIYVYNGGTHIKYIQKKIVEMLKDKVESEFKKKKTKVKFNPNFVSNNIFVFVRGYILDPDFSSQIKDQLDSPINSFESYGFTQVDAKCVWQMLEPYVMGTFLDKAIDKEQKRVHRGRVDVPKCTDARLAGHKTHWKECALFVCEGDSAMGTVHKAITNRKIGLGGYEKYGTFSIQGVPMNARKAVNVIIDKRNGDRLVMRKDSLIKNERLSSLMKVLGLDCAKKYDKSEKGEKEYNTLRYRYIIAATDQDEDGKGNIFGLILNFIALFWVGLVKRGFVRRLNTPIIRCFPKFKGAKSFIKEFYSTEDCRAWKIETFGGNRTDADGGKDEALAEIKMKEKYRVEYYKGLGRHEQHFIPRMFERLREKIITVVWDSKAEENLRTYYDIPAEPRKRVLYTPVDSEYKDPTHITVSEQLNIDTKSYMRDNILRKLPHIMDLLNPSQRGLLFGGIKIFAQSNTPMILDRFVNKTCALINYHHGATSLCQTAAGICFEQNLPFLYDDGNYGTIKEGGADHASSRYTSTHLNKRLVEKLFRKADFQLLPQIDNEGEMIPEWFAPIIPPLYETITLPATGWKVDIFARDIWDLIKNIKGLVEGDIKKCGKLRVWLHKNKGDLRTHNGKVWSVGDYLLDEKEGRLTITELPMLTCSSMFVGDRAKTKDGKHGRRSILNKDVIIEKPTDNTSKDGVEIVVDVDIAGAKQVESEYGNETFDCWETYLGLKTCLTDHINMIGVDGKVREFARYNDVVDEWFIIRKEIYIQRINREIIIIKLKIMHLRNVIKFTKAHQSYKITPKTSIDECVILLTEHKYQTFNVTLLYNPGFTKTSLLEDLILRGPKADYMYLVNMTYVSMMKNACAKRAKDLELLLEELKNLEEDNHYDEEEGIFPGQQTWLSEIEELEVVIKDGLKRGWRYGAEKLDKFED